MTRQIGAAGAVLLTLVLCLSACGGAKKRLTDEEMIALRDHYDLIARGAHPLSYVDYDEVFPTFDQINQYGSFVAVVVLEFVDDWLELGTHSSPYEDNELNQMVEVRIPSAGDVTWNANRVRITDVLWSNETITEGEELLLGFGSVSYCPLVALEQLYVPGERYVFFLENQSQLGFPGVDRLYSTGPAFTFYLTEDDRLVPIRSYAGVNECFGMDLDSFSERVKDVMEISPAG